MGMNARDMLPLGRIEPKELKEGRAIFQLGALSTVDFDKKDAKGNVIPGEKEPKHFLSVKNWGDRDFRLNNTSIRTLIDLFGDDTDAWDNKWVWCEVRETPKGDGLFVSKFKPSPTEIAAAQAEVDAPF